MHLLPKLPSSILSKIEISPLICRQSPSCAESEFISQILKSSFERPLDMIVELAAGVGVQSISFLENRTATDLFMFSSQPARLERNISAYLSSLSSLSSSSPSSPSSHVHYLFCKEKEVFNDVTELRRILSSGKECCIYFDLYFELSGEELASEVATVAIASNRLEACLQHFIDSIQWSSACSAILFRCPQNLVSGVKSALAMFRCSEQVFAQDHFASSCSPPHRSFLLLFRPSYPLHRDHHQLATLWLPQPACPIRRQVESVFTSVMSDRGMVLTALYHAIMENPPRDDAAIWNIAHAAYLSSFPHSGAKNPAQAQSIDRSIVRIYANKMKYVDQVVPLGFRPRQVVCIGGVDAHLGHELAKMYSLENPEQVIVLGEGDRRAEEQRKDYVFSRAPRKTCEQSWAEYRDSIHSWVRDALRNVEEVDMIVTCCPHAVPFFGSILSELIRKLSSDGLLVINDHSVTTAPEQVLLDVIHDFHRKVTCCHVDTVLDGDELRTQEVDDDDQCRYRNTKEWEERLKLFGLQRVVNERNHDMWTPNDLLRTVWGCFSYLGSKNSSVF